MLRSLRCPHCGNQAVSIWRKLELNPRIWSSCRSCGRDITVSWWASVFATLPMFLSVILAFQFDVWGYRLPIIAFGIILSLIIHVVSIPLRFKDNK